MLVSIIISLLPYCLYNFVSSLYILLFLLEAAHISSPGPQVLCCGVIQFWSITSVCSDGSENANPLSTYLIEVPHCSAGEIDCRLGCYISAFSFLPGLLTLVPISGHFGDIGNLGPFCLYLRFKKGQ